ncbi:hypothetical protein D9619_011221 [Psilocybe cf. subviscida]|uniref:Alpha/beta hydrolase fold-3 domain-containing protein n=1 Tax=Psilocybe cf. subviscida TaxID=2480587 RepID=A0A8H5BIV6_9AGAR|nr:hypothetical protein D9619_011221 [Psilocybe cf. subviscida]
MNVQLHPTSVPPLELAFKRVDGQDIFMDVYIPPSATKEKPAPVLLWWHGGGLLQGTRKAVAPHMLSAPERHNICIISADYRLAPQTRMPGILADTSDALAFISSQAFADATHNKVDSARVVLSGSSAGGWIALLVGTGIGFEACGLKKPLPVKGMAPIYPITDLQDRFWKEKQRPTVTYMDRIIEREEVEEFLDPNGEKISASRADGKRSMFYHYMVQEGILSSLLLEGTGIAEEAFSVAPELRTGKYQPPPAYIITGNQDGKVPHRQSLDVLSALEAMSASVEYHELQVDHGFDKEPLYRMDSLYKYFNRVCAE